VLCYCPCYVLDNNTKIKYGFLARTKRFSKVAEDALRQYLRLPKEKIGIEESTTTKKKRGGTKP
jgi:hypothetical protein